MRFFHIRNYGVYNDILAKGGTTVAIKDSPDITNVASGDKITLNIGIATCHEDDNYNKRIGRDISNARIVPMEFTVTEDFSHEGEKYVRLISDKTLLFAKTKNGKLIVATACQTK